MAMQHNGLWGVERNRAGCDAVCFGVVALTNHPA
jgi:hypothetical protein